MDPCGPQKKIASDSHAIRFEKLLEKGGSKGNYGFDVPMNKSKNVGSGEVYKEYQGKVRGKTKHTYGVNGENDPD